MRHFLRRGSRRFASCHCDCGSNQPDDSRQRGFHGWESAFMRHRGHHHEGEDSEGGFGPGGAFGVRRPLRFLAYKLGLEDAQVAQLVKILDELKTERAQAEVDNRRTLAEFADAVSGETFDAEKAKSAGERRVASAAKLRETLVISLQKIHQLLNAEQRERLAYLIRSGILAL